MIEEDDEMVAQIVNATGMQRQSARIIYILWAARGGIITQNHMAERLFDLSGERATLSGISASLKRARRKLDENEVAIYTHYGVGWSLSTSDPKFTWGDPRGNTEFRTRHLAEKAQRRAMSVEMKAGMH